jgi:hypothetical protein
VKLPLSLVATPRGVPFTVTVAPAIGDWSWPDNILPEMFRWAIAGAMQKLHNSRQMVHGDRSLKNRDGFLGFSMIYIL